MNHPPQSVEGKVFFEQQYFPVYGPSPLPIGKTAALFQAFRCHPVLSLLVLGVVCFCLESIWAAKGYVGSEFLLRWRCELLAGLLSILTLWLFCKFRRWGKDRSARAKRQQQYKQEIELLLRQGPIPAGSTHQIRPDELLLTIDYWLSGESVPISERHFDLAQLPDEFIAPDALVLNFQIADRS